jgi:hypothetical protein
MHQKGLVLLLPTTKVSQVPGVHFSPIHWTTKKEKTSGRVLGDTSNDPNNNSLNDKELIVQQIVREKWGDIHHPTLHDIAEMILTMRDKEGSWERLVLWKMDLKGAFSLMRIKDDDIPKLAFELTQGVSLIHVAGMFGWTGTPFAFAVFSRLLQGCINDQISGQVLVYVDDFCGCSGTSSADADQITANRIGEGLMGKDAMAEDKHESGRRLEMIGWTFDLDQHSVSISERNHLKTVYCFFAVDTTKPQHLRTWQGIASRASRYAAVCRQMRPYTSAFHRTVQRFKDDTVVTRIPDSDSIFDLLMWRTFLCLSAFKEKLYARQLDTFRSTPALFKIEYDASLTGMGMIVSRRVDVESEWTVFQHLGLQFPFDVEQDSSYQNTCEFMAATSALFVIANSGNRAFTYDLYGDSISSLQWCQDEHTKSMLARQAMFGFSLLCVLTDANLGSVIHVPGKHNVQCDKLSRGTPAADLGLAPELSVSPPVSAAIIQFLNIVNPLICIKSQEQQERCLQQLVAFFSSLNPDFTKKNPLQRSSSL